MRRLVRAWRRRHAKHRIPLQRRILGDQAMVGIDVGAAEGMQPHWWAYEGAVEMYMFEPHPESARKLEQIYAASPYRDMFHVLQVAVGRENGSRTFHMLNAATGSSLLPIDPSSEFAGPENRYVYPIRTTTVEVRKLSEVLDENGLTRVDVAKLDVQGAELEILLGLDAARSSALTLVEAEVNISGGINKPLSPYVGAPTWAQLDAWFAARDMRLLDLSVSRSYRPKDGDVDWYQREVFDVYTNSPGISALAWEADVVYVRDYRDLIKNGDAQGLRRLVVALGGYRYFSEAYFSIEQAERAGVFSAPDASAIKRDIIAWHRLVARRPWHGRGAHWAFARKVLSRAGLSQLRRWKQYMWFEYPSG